MDITFPLSRKWLMRMLVTIVIVLTAINIFHQMSWYFWQQDYGQLMWRFDIGGDETVPTWFSSVILLICAILLFMVARAEQNQPYPATRRWQGLALIFLALSVDETATLHEWSSSLLGALRLKGVFYYSWVVFGIGFVLLFGLVYSQFYWRLPRRLKARFFLAAALFVGGALVVEMMNARYEYLFGAQTLTYQAMTAVEELMEMVGILIFIDALLSHLGERFSTVTLSLETKEHLFSAADVAALPKLGQAIKEKIRS